MIQITLFLWQLPKNVVTTEEEKQYSKIMKKLMMIFQKWQKNSKGFRGKKMLTFKTYSNYLEDRLLVPYYQVLIATKKFQLTIGKLASQIVNGIDIRNYREDGTPYLRAGDIKRCQVDMVTPKRVSLMPEGVPERIQIKEGDVLITRKGTAGVASIVSSDCKNSIIGTEIIKVRLKIDAKVSPEYLYTLLNSKIGIMQIQGKLTGTVSRGINHPSLKTIKIPTLSDKKQKEIDGWIKKAKERHTQSLNLIWKAFSILMQNIAGYKEKEIDYYKIDSNDLKNMITPKFYYPQYIRTISSIKEKFDTVKLVDIVEKVEKGQETGSENYRTYLDKVENDVPFIRTSDLPNYEVDDYPDYYVDEGVFENLNQNLREGDIIFSKDGKIGLTALFTEVDKCILASGLSIIKLKDREDYPYIFAVLSSFVGKFQALQRTVISSTIPHLNIERAKEMEIPLLDEGSIKEIKRSVLKAFELKKEKKQLIRKAKKEIEKLVLGE